MPSDQQEQLLSFFKEVVKQSELAEKHYYKFSSGALNLNDSSDSDFEIPNELAIAYNEALGGALMCVIPSLMYVTQGVGIGMIGDAASRTYDYLEKRNLNIDPEHNSFEKNGYEPSHDRDSWDKEY